MFASFVIVLSFISAIPVPQRVIPLWDCDSLRYFCPMLPVAGIIFGLLWSVIWSILTLIQPISTILRGFMMTVLTLGLTGGLHLDGLMDTCDAIFSHAERETRLRILSDTHSGSFAVMGCVVIILGKTLLFGELLGMKAWSVLVVPVLSRLGMGFLLNTMPFAKSGGLAVMLGGARNPKHNVFFAVMMILLIGFSSKVLVCVFVLSLMLWRRICMRIFGGITGDLLGAFVEISEVIMLLGMVMSKCM